VKEQVNSAEPIELSTIESQEIHTSETALEVEDSVDLLEKIKTDEAYKLAARFIALAVRENELVQYLPKNKAKLPSEFATTIDELVNYDFAKPIIPEAFSESQLVGYLSSSRLFTLSHMEKFDFREQFEYIFKRYMELVRERNNSSVYGRVHSILSDSKGNQIELLEKALESEANMLEGIV